MRFYSLLFLVTISLLSMKCQTSASTQATAPAATASAAADPKAAAIAQEVMQAMGGKVAWDNTPYLAWTFNNQYHLWNRKTNDLRYERGDSLVIVTNLDSNRGKMFLRGQEVTDTAKVNPWLRRMYAVWANNSYWFIMPYKLQDEGVTLKYMGEGKTQAGADADILQMTFNKVGVTPDNKYLLAVDKQSRLITEWSYFNKYTDEKPAFTRPWSNYQRVGPIMLSSGRSTDATDRLNIRDIAAPASVPAAMFNNPRPIEKSQLK